MSGEKKTIAIKLCIGSSCHLKGANNVSEAIQDYLAMHAQALAQQGNIEFAYDFCTGDCANGVCVSVIKGKEETKLRKVSAETIAASLDACFGIEG